MKEKVKRFFSCNRMLLKPFLVLFLIYLLGASAIILAGVHFADDIARTNYGYAGWNGFSRYTSTILAYLLNMDGYLANIAPLPQILAVGILALAGVLVICVVMGKEIFEKSWTKWIFPIIAVVPLGLSPYMLECLSYQYDAPYMAISVLFAVLPILFSKQKGWIYSLAILISVLVICTTYQAAVGIFLMLVIMVAMKEWSENKKSNKEIWKFVLISVGMFFLTLVIFQKMLMKPREAYASNSLPGITELIPKFFEHLGTFLGLVFSDFKILWLVMIGLICLGFVAMFVINSKRNKIWAGVVGLVGGFLIIVLSFAFYAVLDKPLYATRAMYPFGVAIAILGVVAVSGRGKMAVWKVPVAILAWCFVVFALVYGNALREQENYRNMVIDMVMDDLNEMPLVLDEGTKYIQATGSLGWSPVILHMPRDYKILQRLLMPSYSMYVPWMAYRLTQQSGFSNLVYDESVDLTEIDLPVLKKTVFYNIRGDKQHILVEFKDKTVFDVVF